MMPPEPSSPHGFAASLTGTATAATRTLVVGCGSPLRGDDAAGPAVVARLRDRGVPAGVRCVDCGTDGIDVAIRMRGCEQVVVVDACRSESEPGTLFEVPAEELARLPPPRIDGHAFRWDHALALARWLLGDDHPRRVTAILVEGRSFEVGAPLSPEVDRAVDRLADGLHARLGRGE